MACTATNKLKLQHAKTCNPTQIALLHAPMSMKKQKELPGFTAVIGTFARAHYDTYETFAMSGSLKKSATTVLLYDTYYCTMLAEPTYVLCTAPLSNSATTLL